LGELGGNIAGFYSEGHKLSLWAEKIAKHRTKSTAMRWSLIAARLAMAGIFIFASIDKIAHPAAFAKDVFNYQILPDAMINLTALVLPWLELLLGLCLLAGVWMPGAVLSANGLLLIFLAALVFNLARGLDVNCGCFSTGSDAPAMSTTYYLVRDIGFLALGAFLFYGVFLVNRPEGPKQESVHRLENAKGEASR
jgi:uncharacterized membrane protein YphA (DoxX/SURF4 family)